MWWWGEIKLALFVSKKKRLSTRSKISKIRKEDQVSHGCFVPLLHLLQPVPHVHCCFNLYYEGEDPAEDLKLPILFLRPWNFCDASFIML